MMFPLRSNSAFSFLLRIGSWCFSHESSQCVRLWRSRNSSNIYRHSRGRIVWLFVGAPSAVRCRYRYYSPSWFIFRHQTSVYFCAFRCNLPLPKHKTEADNNTQLLDIRRCEELVPIWPGGVGADLKTRRVEVFNYNPLCGLRHCRPPFTIKTSS